MVTKENGARRIAALTSDSKGHALWATLDVKSGDLIVEKNRFSAFIQGSSNLAHELRTRGLDTVLIAGTVTNVCCESTARDASMMEYRVAMLSDANATLTDEEHAAALNGFQVSFGDVMTVDEALARLVPAQKRSAA